MLKSLLSSKTYSTDTILLLARLALGAFMLFAHGWPKLERLGGEEVKFYDFIGLGATVSLVLALFAEVVCSLLLALGLFTRLATFFLAFTMFVAAFIAGADKPFQNRELALLYLLAYTLLFFTGPGKFSLDRLLRKEQ